MSERLDAFMARAGAAYYAARDPFADFTTAPEITQVFGELLGAWAAVAWRQLGAPAPCALVELGPGRGTMMADARRAIAAAAPDFAAALSLHLVETAPRLRAAQRARLPDATWHDAIDTLPAGPAIVLANEFLDALPIRQFRRDAAGWAERHVAAGAPVWRPCPAPGDDAPVGTVIERREAAERIATTLGQGFAAAPGAALFIDYGAEGGRADTVQALRDGRAADPWARPGEADLTAHVDFAAFAAAARAAGAAVHGPVYQADLLTRLGLFARTDRLARGKAPPEAIALHEAARRLTDPRLMGTLFRAVALTAPGLPTPPGFAA